MQLARFRFWIFKEMTKSSMEFFISYLVPYICKIISQGMGKKNQTIFT